MPGTFADRPEDAGMLFQWNRIKGWNTTDTIIWEGWDTDNLYTDWCDENNPCPSGWRLPTLGDFQTLLINSSDRETLNGVTGRFFGIAPNQIFLPASGWRSGNAGSLVGAGRAGAFWSETPGTSTLQGVPFAWHMLFNEVNNGIVVNQVSSTFAFSVRCVAE